MSNVAVNRAKNGEENPARNARFIILARKSNSTWLEGRHVTMGDMWLPRLCFRLADGRHLSRRSIYCSCAPPAKKHTAISPFGRSHAQTLGDA